MSFDLGVWHTPQRLTDAEAGALYAALCELRLEGVTPHPAVDAFHAELTARYPEIDTVPDDRIDDTDYCPWSCALNRSPGHVLMPCVWSQAENVERLVRQLARKHGLAVYDPQQGRVSYPGGSAKEITPMTDDAEGWSDDDSDPRMPRPLRLSEAIPPVRWPLALLAGVCCGVGAGWEWATSGLTRVAVMASLATVAWLVFAGVRFALWWGGRRRTRRCT